MWIEKRLQYIKIPLQFLSVGNIVTFFLFDYRNAKGFRVPPGRARGLGIRIYTVSIAIN
jgi:hypothetical protein